MCCSYTPHTHIFFIFTSSSPEPPSLISPLLHFCKTSLLIVVVAGTAPLVREGGGGTSGPKGILFSLIASTGGSWGSSRNFLFCCCSLSLSPFAELRCPAVTEEGGGGGGMAGVTTAPGSCKCPAGMEYGGYPANGGAAWCT